MPLKYTVTLTSVGTSYVVVVPKPIVDGFGLKKGQKLEMIVKDNGIFITLPVSSIRDPSVTEESARP